MVIGGLQRFSLIDFPGKISAIIFTLGCNFRCPYCHNPELVDPKQYTETLQQDNVMDFLESRTGKLDAVVISGGEPTLHADLPEFVQRIKAMGFLVKLDTNGTNPDLLEELISRKLLDYVAMDIKAPLCKYEEIARVPVNMDAITQSIELLKHALIPHEFRTTIDKSLLTTKDIIDMAALLQGEELYILQQCVTSKVLDKAFMENSKPYDDRQLDNVVTQAQKYVKRCFVR